MNDLLQSYFTSLNKVRHPSLFELAEGTGREFKAYIPGDVRCYSDRYGRWLTGTIFGSPEPFWEPLWTVRKKQSVESCVRKRIKKRYNI